MPPVRWKLVAAVLCIALSSGKCDPLKRGEAMSMTDDGWRPIVGNNQKEPSFQEEITYYRNPIQGSETVKAETPRQSTPSMSTPTPPPQSPQPKASTKFPPKQNHHQNNNKGQIIYGGKIASHHKHTQHQHQSNQNHKAVHGPHIPLSHKGHRGPPNPHYKHPIVQKSQTHSQAHGKRHKPPVHRGAGGHREEILSASATSNIGSYAYYHQVPNGLKPRGPHPQQQIDYSNFGVPAPNSDVYQHYNTQPVQQFVFQKNPIQNDVYYTFQSQNDEYTRNLVPPPPYKIYQEKDKPKLKPVYKTKEPVSPVTETIQSLVTDKFKNTQKPITNANGNVVPSFIPQQNQYNLQSFPKNINGQTVDIEITKEKLNVYHNNVPNNFRPIDQYQTFGTQFSVGQQNEAPQLQPYEVTEGKYWQGNPQNLQFSTRIPEYQFVDQSIYNQQIQQDQKLQHQSQRPIQRLKPQQQIVEQQQQQQQQVHFLPTPFIPEISAPTLPTQSEVSTIYNEVANLNRQKVENPSFFSVKEVSTHYPIFGRPQNGEVPSQYSNVEPETEVPTTVKNDELKIEEITTQPSVEPPKNWRNNNRRRKPNNRNRPTSTTDTVIGIVTESYDPQKDQIKEISQEEPQRPLRRRPSRYRTTTEKPKEAPINDEQYVTRKKSRIRIRPTQQTLEEEMPYNHKMTEEEIRVSTEATLTGPGVNEHYRTQQTTEREYQESLEEQYMESFQKLEDSDSNSDDTRQHLTENINVYDLSNPYEKSPQFYENTKLRRPIPERSEDFNDQPETGTTNNVILTTVTVPSTTYQTTENFAEASLNSVVPQEFSTEETTLATTSTTTSTTTEAATTTKSRSKLRLNKYDSNRPRFSVKDYKQRLNQYSTTTTTEKAILSSISPRVRLSNRFRKPVPASLTPEPEETTEVYRSKFVPKDARHHFNQEQGDESSTEKQSRVSRVRPYGRFRSTTEAPTTTPKISIKPNLFANRRRPPSISLKNRIINKQKSTEDTSTTKLPETTTIIDSKENEVPKELETTEAAYLIDNEPITTEFISRKVSDIEPGESTDQVETEIPDTLNNESYLYSQRVSDLTSAAKYDTPGLFKAVSPNSRRVPSYFTIATDDPILPIEAFFPNLKENKE